MQSLVVAKSTLTATPSLAPSKQHMRMIFILNFKLELEPACNRGGDAYVPLFLAIDIAPPRITLKLALAQLIDSYGVRAVALALPLG